MASGKARASVVRLDRHGPAVDPDRHPEREAGRLPLDQVAVRAVEDRQRGAAGAGVVQRCTVGAERGDGTDGPGAGPERQPHAAVGEAGDGVVGGADGRPAGPTASNARSAMPWWNSWIRVVVPRNVSRASCDTPCTSSARIALP